MPGRVGHDDIQAFYALIDVFVVPRTPDRVSRLVTPLKPLEAMALERCVVVSDVPALRELVIPGETGRTFTAGDPEDLARVLDDLLGDPGGASRSRAPGAGVGRARAHVGPERAALPGPVRAPRASSSPAVRSGPAGPQAQDLARPHRALDPRAELLTVSTTRSARS